MNTFFDLKPNLPTRGEKQFLKDLRKTIQKPLKNPLPKTKELSCRLGNYGSWKTLTIFKNDNVFAVLRSFQPVISRDIRNNRNN